MKKKIISTENVLLWAILWCPKLMEDSSMKRLIFFGMKTLFYGKLKNRKFHRSTENKIFIIVFLISTRLQGELEAKVPYCNVANDTFFSWKIPVWSKSNWINPVFAHSISYNSRNLNSTTPTVQIKNTKVYTYEPEYKMFHERVFKETYWRRYSSKKKKQFQTSLSKIIKISFL